MTDFKPTMNLKQPPLTDKRNTQVVVQYEHTVCSLHTQPLKLSVF